MRLAGGKKIKPDSDLGNAEDWENVAIQRGDELSKIHAAGNTKGQKIQFPQQIKDKGKREEEERLCGLKLQYVELI